MKIYDYSGRANISGDRIHQARTAQRLSQDALAAKMQVCGGLGREAISRIETGDRFVTDYELAIFARVLGVSLEWLTGDLEQKE
jgi:transcriptional regulator with XRE-family HTH domain